jgi:hypothetical protein
MSAVGEPLIVRVTIPCSVEVVPRGHQNRKPHIVWDEGAIAIEKVDAAAAPVAFRVVAQAADRRDYEIRRFRGRLWWPLFEAGAPMQTSSFVASAPRSDGCFLSSLNLSPSTLAAPRDANGFELPWFIGRIEVDSRAERWVQANRSAAKLLSCEGIMHAEGGAPAYFAVRLRAAISDEPKIVVGQLRPGASAPGDRWHCGPDASRRQSAVLASKVLAASDPETATGFKDIDRLVALEKLEAYEQPADQSDVVRYSAHVLADMVLRSASASPDASIELSCLNRRDARTGLIDIMECREILRLGVGLSADTNGIRSGVSTDRARAMIATIDTVFPPPTLSPEDLKALWQLEPTS